MESLGKKFRLFRHERGWRQCDIALKLDISVPAYSKIESGITDINLSRLEQIARVFEMTVAEFLTDQINEPVGLKEAENLLRAREEEVIELQKKVIDLYEEVRSLRASKEKTKTTSSYAELGY